MDRTVSWAKDRVERMTHSSSLARFSARFRTWSNLVVNKFSAVRIPPFGPRLYLQSTFSVVFFQTLGREEACSLLHDLLIIHSVSDVYVGVEGRIGNSRVEVEDVRRSVLRVKMGVEPLHESRLS